MKAFYAEYAVGDSDEIIHWGSFQESLPAMFDAVRKSYSGQRVRIWLVEPVPLRAAKLEITGRNGVEKHDGFAALHRGGLFVAHGERTYEWHRCKVSWDQPNVATCLIYRNDHRVEFVDMEPVAASTAPRSKIGWLG